MIELQVINKILEQGSMAFILRNNLDETYFPEFLDEYKFIFDYFKKYGTVPSRSTFIDHFPEFEILDIRDSEDYLLDKLREEYLFNRSLPIMKEVSERMKTNSFEAFNFLKANMGQLALITDGGATDLIKDGSKRLASLDERASQGSRSCINCGLPELDESIYGWMRGEELVTIMARTGEGKTWLLVYFMVSAWEQGYTVGVYSGEMSAEKIGYRFDTILRNFSNNQLIRGTLPKLEEYRRYIEELQKSDKKPFWIITPKDLGGKATVTQLETFVDTYKIDILGIDQYSLLKDERGSRYADTREQLEHLSSDLFELSIRKKIPIIVVSQANRSGAKQEGEKGTPDIESIYGADAIGQNSTKILSFRQSGPGLELSVKKNRDGRRGDKFIYNWDPDSGILRYVPSDSNKRDEDKITENYNKFGGEREPF